MEEETFEVVDRGWIYVLQKQCEHKNIIRTREDYVCRDCGVVMKENLYADESYSQLSEYMTSILAEKNFKRMRRIYRYQLNKVHDILFGTGFVNQGYYMRMRLYLQLNHISKVEFETFGRKDVLRYLEVMGADEGVTLQRRNKVMQRWVTLKYRTLDVRRPLRFQSNFCERLDHMIILVCSHWFEKQRWYQKNFVRIQFLLACVLPYVDDNFSLNKEWYILHLEHYLSPSALNRHKARWETIARRLHLPLIP